MCRTFICNDFGFVHGFNQQRKSDCTMQHLNPYRFYELAAKLHGLFNNATRNRVVEMFSPLTETQAVLDSLIKGDPLTLETSKADATKLLNKISSIFNKYYIDQSTRQLKTPTGEDRIDQQEMALVYALVEKFEHSLAAELNHAPTYKASKRGIYSTYDLVENAYHTFSQNLLSVIPASAQSEFNTAGRALAFGLGTAAAVHLLRAIEIELKQYYELFSGTKVAKTERNYSIYLKKLATLAEDENNTHRPDRRLLQMLAQIKEHYRNPLTSPDINVTTEQATSLFGLASAIITLMAEQIADYNKSENGSVKESKTETPIISEASEEAEENIDFRLTQAGQ